MNEQEREVWVPDRDGRVLPGRGDSYDIRVPVAGLIPYREPWSLSRRLRRLINRLFGRRP